MIRLDIAKKKSLMHDQVCCFARQVYLERLDIEITVFPQVIIYAKKKGKIVGSFGLTPGNENNPLLVETYFDFNLLRHISKDQTMDNRNVFGEIGTLATSKDADIYIPLILCAAMIVWSKQQKYKFLAMTATKVVQRVARPLGINLIRVGEPSLVNKDAVFRKKWENYFKLRPSTIGVNIEQAFPSCFEALTRVPKINYHSLISQ